MIMSEIIHDSITRVAPEDDNEYSVQLIRWFLKPIGVWPVITSRSEKMRSESLIFICSSLLILMMLPCALNIFLEEHDLNMQIKAFGPFSFWIMAALKYLSLVLNRGGIKQCLQHISTDWKIIREINDRNIMLRNAKIGRYIAAFCMIFVNTGTFSYDVVRGISTMVVLIDNESVSFHPLPYPFYNGFVDTKVSPAYEIILILQYFSTFVVNTITVGACSLAAIFIMHACGQLGVLMSWFNSLIDKEKKIVDFQKRLAVVVEHHLRVLSFITHVEEIMHHICLVELVGCTLNICLLGYYFIMEWQMNEVNNIVTYSIIFVSITFNIFIFCYIGEILTEQCKLVGEIAYMAYWYRLPKRTALAFVLIISRSSSVMKLSAGKIIQLSLATFGDVIRTSITYLNLLRTVTV